jgi:hypothetical protein
MEIISPPQYFALFFYKSIFFLQSIFGIPESIIAKHTTSPKNPLLIEIKLKDDQFLAVSNNLQPKTSAVKSNRMGLTNIAAKYQLISKKAIKISDSNGHFTVELPLIVPT